MLQRPGAGRAARADRLGSHHHLRHVGRAQPCAWRDVHARRLCGLGRLHLFQILHRRGDRWLPIRGASRGADGAANHPAFLCAAARRPATRHLWPRHRFRGGRPLLLRQPVEDRPAAGVARRHHAARLHGVSDLPAGSARHRDGRAAGSLLRALPNAHRHDRARGDRGFGDGRFAWNRRLQDFHAGLRHRRHGGGLRRHRQCAGGLDRARCWRIDPGADFRRCRHRRRRLLPRRGSRRPYRGRDHQHHLDVQPRLRLCHAFRRDDVRARGPSLRAPWRGGPGMTGADPRKMTRRFAVEAFAALALIVTPFVLPHLGFSPSTINRILIWGLFGLGFDLLFGYAGLLSFGQSAFFGTGGMFAAYLLTVVNFPFVLVSIVIGAFVSGVVGYLVGLIALRRTGIYFAMITVAIAEVFFFVEFNPLSDFTGGENGLPGVPAPSIKLGLTTLRFNTDWSMYVFLAFWYFVGLVIALRIVGSPVGAILRALRDNPLRASALGHDIHGYKLTAFVVAAIYAGFAGGLLGAMQGFMPPDAFTFDTSGQLVMQTAIGGAGTLFGPLVGAAVWLYLSDFFQNTLHLGATWKLLLGIVFVLLVCFLRHGIVGAAVDLYKLAARRKPTASPAAASEAAQPLKPVVAKPLPARRRSPSLASGPILEARGLTKRYGGLVANNDIDFTVDYGEARGIIGPNGAGKSTFFKMLNC